MIPELVNGILGALILKPSLLSGSGLTQDDFPAGRSRETFLNISSMWEESQPNEIDAILLASNLDGDSPQAFVASLTDGALKLEPEVFNNRVAELRKEAITRRVLGNIERQAKTGVLNIDEIRPDLEEYDRLAAGADGLESSMFQAHLPALLDWIERARSGKFLGFETKSFPALNEALSGIRETIVLGAVPKIGKTTLLSQIAHELSDQGVGVLYYDFENGRYPLMIRELCRRYRFSYRGELLNANHGWENIVTRLNDLYNTNKNLAIITDRGLTVEKIQSHILEMRRRTGQNRIFLAIDSLQKLPVADLRERRAGIDSWLRNLETLKAEDPDLAVMAISELSREGKLKESGDIAYSAHFILELEPGLDEAEMKEFGDDGRRKLWVRYARDIARPKGPIILRGHFDYWEFTEDEFQ